MKSVFSFILFGLISSLYAQFPEPTSLVDSLKYAHTGETLSCNGQTYGGGTNCHRFFWSVPDTTGIASKLIGYNIYHDEAFFKTTTEPKYEFEGTLTGRFCVAAIYETPTGESGCSDEIVLQSALQLKPISSEKSPHLVYDKATRQFVLQNGEIIPSPSIYGLDGKRVNASQLKAGIYLIQMKTNRSLIRMKILVPD